jgi:hypothetical protein
MRFRYHLFSSADLNLLGFTVKLYVALEVCEYMHSLLSEGCLFTICVCFSVPVVT